MTLNDNLRNWLAQNAGSNNCYTSAGISYSDPDGVSRTGGTGDVLNAYYVAHLLGKDTVIIKANTNYTGIKTINGGNDVALDDVTWAYNNDGSPAGQAQYCYTAPATGSISVTLSPVTASLYLDGGTQAYASGTTIQNVPAGNHSYIAKATGYKDKAGGVPVYANQTAIINETLELILTDEKVTIDEKLAGNYNCYGFTIPKDQFTCATASQTAKVYAIYSTGDCASTPADFDFIWYQWNLIQLEWSQYQITPPLQINPGFCRTEVDLPCGYMYKVMFGNIEKVFTVTQAGHAEFGLGWLPLAAIAAALLLAVKK